MINPNVTQRGFALIVSMIVLLVMTVLVINAVRNTSLNEKMSGNYMDRTRAFQAAEQGLRQGEAALASDICSGSSGCQVTSLAPPTVVNATGTPATAIPSSWSDTGALTIVPYTVEQHTSGKLNVTLLADSFVPTSKTGCKAYSLMSKGVGLDSRAEVVLQTTAFVCSL